MTYVDPVVPDDQVVGSERRAIAKDKAEADDFEREVFFAGPSTYRGSASALRRMAGRTGRSVQPDWLLQQDLEAKRGADDLLPPD